MVPRDPRIETDVDASPAPPRARPASPWPTGVPAPDPPEPTADAVVSAAELADLLLDPTGRQVYERAAADAPHLDGEALATRHPEVDRWLVDVEPGENAHLELLLIAAAEHGGTLVELDWSGEDEIGGTRRAVTDACSALGLGPPGWDDDTEEIVMAHLGDEAVRGSYVPALLRSLDAQLATVGVRLVAVDMDTDSYQVAPVPAERFAGLCGAAFGPYRLDAVDRVEA